MVDRTPTQVNAKGVYSIKFIRARRSWKRGAERRGSNAGVGTHRWMFSCVSPPRFRYLLVFLARMNPAVIADIAI